MSLAIYLLGVGLAAFAPIWLGLRFNPKNVAGVLFAILGGILIATACMLGLDK